MEVETGIASILNKDPKIIRFFAARMLVELTLERPLTKEEQQKLFHRCRTNFLREVGESG
uniref:Uncharacterized protein n=1 Tax=viral metagenome TaxID=1070528 RepID=A0A6M3JGT6_9ZZZZ